MKLTNVKRKLIQKIAKQYSLELLLLFGSQVSGKTNKESDFDVAYLSKKGLDLMQEALLITNLFSVFRSEKVDLTNLKKASPLLFYAIFQKCEVLYAKDSLLFPTLRAYAFKKYVEAKPLYELKFKRLREKIKAL